MLVELYLQRTRLSAQGCRKIEDINFGIWDASEKVVSKFWTAESRLLARAAQAVPKMIPWCNPIFLDTLTLKNDERVCIEPRLEPGVGDFLEDRRCRMFDSVPVRVRA